MDTGSPRLQEAHLLSAPPQSMGQKQLPSGRVLWLQNRAVSWARARRLPSLSSPAPWTMAPFGRNSS